MGSKGQAAREGKIMRVLTKGRALILICSQAPKSHRLEQAADLQTIAWIKVNSFIYIQKSVSLPEAQGKILAHVDHAAAETASDQSFLFVAPQPTMRTSLFLLIKAAN